jgi:hypothetical protein
LHQCIPGIRCLFGSHVCAGDMTCDMTTDARLYFISGSRRHMHLRWCGFPCSPCLGCTSKGTTFKVIPCDTILAASLFARLVSCTSSARRYKKILVAARRGVLLLQDDLQLTQPVVLGPVW